MEQKWRELEDRLLFLRSQFKAAWVVANDQFEELESIEGLFYDRAMALMVLLKPIGVELEGIEDALERMKFQKETPLCPREGAAVFLFIRCRLFCLASQNHPLSCLFSFCRSLKKTPFLGQ